MKGYYLAEDNDAPGRMHYPGVENKINIQIKELKKKFEIEQVGITEKIDMISKIKKRIPFVKKNTNYCDILKHINNAAFLYIRKPYIEKGFVSFLRQVKQKEQKCKIIMEIPTYPYDTEFLGDGKIGYKFKIYPLFIKEKYNRDKLYKYVDRIVTYSNDDEIWNIKTIKTINGIDVNRITIKKCQKNNEQLNIISVASMQKHHGYDRLIYGIKDYYKNGGTRNVVYHVVGDGAELQKYKKIVNEYDLQNNIIFYGMLSGNDLDKIYDKADIAVASLGMHRINLTRNSTLKTREYLAKGIPFIYSGEIDVFERKNINFAFSVPANEKPIDINKIINFYDTLKQNYGNYNNLTNTIRQFAKENVDISIAMKPVIEYINIK